MLTLLASLWWIAGLWAQGGYGLDILRFTETLSRRWRTRRSRTRSCAGSATGSSTAATSSAPGSSRQRRLHAGPSGSSPSATRCPCSRSLSAAVVRWRHRAFFVVVHARRLRHRGRRAPVRRPVAARRAVQGASPTSSSFGLALRSTGRAVPLVALGARRAAGRGRERALPPGRGRGACRWSASSSRRWSWCSRWPTCPSLWQTARSYGEQPRPRPRTSPPYWTAAIADLDARMHGTRVLEIPGADFASYRWGNTVDPITPGLMDRPYVARELVPWGSPATADLLNALDRRIQEDVLDPAALAPMARLMSVGDIVLPRPTSSTDRFDLPRAVLALAAPHRPRATAGARGTCALRRRTRSAAALLAGRRGRARAAGRRRRAATGVGVRGRGHAAARACRLGRHAAARVGERGGARRPRGVGRARQRPHRALLGDVRRRPEGAARRGRTGPTRCSWSRTRTASAVGAGVRSATRTARPTAPTSRRSPTTRTTPVSICSRTRAPKRRPWSSRRTPRSRPPVFGNKITYWPEDRGGASARRRRRHRVGGGRPRTGPRRADPHRYRRTRHHRRGEPRAAPRAGRRGTSPRSRSRSTVKTRFR